MGIMISPRVRNLSAISFGVAANDWSRVSVQ